MKNPYEWYKLGEDIRNQIYLKNETFFIENHGVYLPVLWSNPHINYGQQYGLLCFPRIYGGAYDSVKYKGKKWFGVRVFSPDDWDLDFDIDLPPEISNQDADMRYDYLIKITKDNVITGSVDPYELFSEIKREFIIKYLDSVTNLF